jgi:GNAT superfamily N-acetyltransferase
VRAARDAADDDEIARIASAAFPDWPLTGPEVAAARRRRADRFHLRLVAEDADCLAAYGYIEVPYVAATTGRLRILLLVDPARSGRGTGSTLYCALETEARQRGASELVGEVLESHPRALRFVQDRGYTVYNSRVESRLSMASVRPAQIAQAIDEHTDRLFASGLRIASYQQMLPAAADAPRRMYELFRELWHDVPFGLTGDDATYDTYVAEELEDPEFQSAGSFVALDGDDWVGMCTNAAPPDRLVTTMTGVVRRWRRQSVAHWLKLHSIRYALDMGFDEIRTFNDVANTGMLALNRALGFEPLATELRVKKELR